MGISGLINVEKREKDAGLYLAEPFDPDRIPVVMIHGLSSSLWFGERSPPVSWAIHRFAGITSFSTFTIRPECRFWSRPHRYAMKIAAIRRHMIRAERRCLPSPGARWLQHGRCYRADPLNSSGNRLWDAIAKVPFDQVAIDSEDRAELEKLLFWKPVPGLDRTIFIATRIRGTQFADSGWRALAVASSGCQEISCSFKCACSTPWARSSRATSRPWE